MLPKISYTPKKSLGSSRQATFRVAFEVCLWEIWQIVSKGGAAVGTGVEAH